MRSKLLSGVAALALTAGTIMASAAPASAAPWGWHHGWGWPGAVAAGVVGGAVAAATSPLWAPGYYDYYPGYAYGAGYGTYDYAPGPYVAAAPMVAQGGTDVSYCEQRFRSYNPSTGTYLGFDGQYHACP
jgi:hypothetical protein